MFRMVTFLGPFRTRQILAAGDEEHEYRKLGHFHCALTRKCFILIRISAHLAVNKGNCPGQTTLEYRGVNHVKARGDKGHELIYETI